MPEGYRIEYAPSSRAGCSNYECKNGKLKISKGSLRWGVLIEQNERPMLIWRHWGCVTPAVLAKWKEFIGSDTGAIDGFEELSAADQAIVTRVLDQGHVDDEDWNGVSAMPGSNDLDPELNRPGKSGFRVKKRKTSGEDNSGEDEEPKPKRGRGRPKKNEALKVDNEEDSEVDTPSKKIGGRPKKDSIANDEKSDAAYDDGQDMEDVKPAAKKGRGRPKKAAVIETAPSDTGELKAVDQSNVEMEDEQPAPKKGRGRGRPKKTVSSDADERKAVDEADTKPKAVDQSGVEMADQQPAPKKGRGRPRKAVNVADEGAENVKPAAPKRGRGRPKKTTPAAPTTPEPATTTPEADEGENAEAQASPEVVVTQPKKRGRPKKTAPIVDADGGNEAEHVAKPKANASRKRVPVEEAGAEAPGKLARDRRAARRSAAEA
ncbi:zf-PARP-domain-containing protein [Trichodelitschia bisporula]|uniref:Zf-PARP-domain-containing protein n=1 Tax=Trichodelitschia bisporula TaxID=703511 RepID=A0A6G1HR21_9PEZI|nr:zf-PARP-domain-containing protein [Trichodelitschia bisporula]